MRPKVFSLIDSILTWIERIQRTPWGGKVVALLIALLLTLFQAIYGLPWVLYVPLGIITFAALVFLLLFLPAWINQIRPLPFAVAVPTIFEADDNIQLHTLVLNRRRDGRVVLVLDLVLVSEDGRQRWNSQFESNCKLDLHQEEFAEGTIKFRLHGQFWRDGKWNLRVSDMLSGRRTPMFVIPGTYPNDGPILRSNKVPTFTKRAEQPSHR